jgi:hypothetical protein
VAPGSAEWRAYLQSQRANNVIFDPTFKIYSASRDLMCARNGDWHNQYTLPSLRALFLPSRVNHGSYWYDWTTAREIAWRRFYGPYMRLMNEEAIQSATRYGAEASFEPKGIESPGMLADLVIVPENPLHNFKTLYGTGFERVGQDGRVQRVGGVRWTIKDGIVYDPRRLLADVARWSRRSKGPARTSPGTGGRLSDRHVRTCSCL